MDIRELIVELIKAMRRGKTHVAITYPGRYTDIGENETADSVYFNSERCEIVIEF